MSTESTLLFIDEIQHCAEAVQSLRYLKEDVKGLHVIAAGSLLEVFSKREGVSFPVGRVKHLFMYPVTFMEYLETQNAPLAEKLLQPDILKDASLHGLLLDAFNAYAFVGGMPEVFAAFGETGSYSAVREMKEAFDVLERALLLYRAKPSVSTRLPKV